MNNIANCIRKKINNTSVKKYFKFDKNTYDGKKILEEIQIVSPKLYDLINNIQELDKNDMEKYGKKFKHIIYSDIKDTTSGIKLIASGLKAIGFNNIYNNKLQINIPENNNNFALLTSVTIYEKPFPVKLRNEIIKIFNKHNELKLFSESKILIETNSLYLGDTYTNPINNFNIKISETIDPKFILNKEYLKTKDNSISLEAFSKFLIEIGINENKKICSSLTHLWNNNYSINAIRFCIFNDNISCFESSYRKSLSFINKNNFLVNSVNLYLNDSLDSLKCEKFIDYSLIINDAYTENLNRQQLNTLKKIFTTFSVKSQKEFITS